MDKRAAWNALREKIVRLQSEGRLDLKQPFAATFVGELDAEGLLTNRVATETSGDATMLETAADFVTAMSDSGSFAYSKYLMRSGTNGKRAVVSLVQNVEEFSLCYVVETDDEAKAKRSALALNAMLQFGRLKGKDERTFIDGTNVSVADGRFTIDIKVAREFAVRHIEKQLAKPDKSG